MNQSQQALKSKYQSQIAKFRQAFPPKVSIFTQFMSLFKNVGSKIMTYLSNLQNLFQSSQEKPYEPINMMQYKKQRRAKDQAKIRGRKLNFNDFKKTENQPFKISRMMQYRKQSRTKAQVNKKGWIFFIKAKLQKQARRQKIKYIIKKNRVRFQFKKKQNKQKIYNFYDFRQILAQKKVQKDYEDEQHIIRELSKKVPKETIKRLNQIQQQATCDRIQILLQARQLRLDEEANKSKATLQQTHQKYLKSLGIDNQKDGTKGNHAKLQQMLTRLRIKAQRRFLRKKKHQENDVPPILCLQKVRQVLQIQRQQFYSRNKRLLEQNRQTIKNNEENDNRHNIQQKQDHYWPVVQKPRYLQNLVLFESLPDQKKIQQQGGFQTPPNKQNKQRLNLLANSDEQNKSSKSNPFINKKVSPVSLEELMKKQPSLMFPSSQLPPIPQPTIGSIYFPQNSQVPNVFAFIPSSNSNFTKPNNLDQISNQKYNSPTNFMEKTVQKLTNEPQYILQHNLNQPNQLYDQRMNQNSQFFDQIMNINISDNQVQRSNLNNKSGREISPYLQQQNTVLSGQSGYASDSPFYGNLHNYNPGAAKIFDLNLFTANNPAPTSLFGSANQEKMKQPPIRRKNKNQIRIN